MIQYEMEIKLKKKENGIEKMEETEDAVRLDWTTDGPRLIKPTGVLFPSYAHDFDLLRGHGNISL